MDNDDWSPAFGPATYDGFSSAIGDSTIGYRDPGRGKHCKVPKCKAYHTKTSLYCAGHGRSQAADQ